MEVIVHYPKTKDAQEELSKRVSTVHSQNVIQYIRQLQCPVEQKNLLVEAVQKSTLHK